MSWVVVVSRCGAGLVAFAGRAAPVTAPGFEGDAEVRDFDGCVVAVAVFLPAAAGALPPPTSLPSAPARRLTAPPADLATAEVFCTAAAGLRVLPADLRAAGCAARPEPADLPPLRVLAAFLATGFFAAALRAVFAAAVFLADGFCATGFFTAAFFGSALVAPFFAADDFAPEAFFDGAGFATRGLELGTGFLGAALLAAAFFATAFLTAGFVAAFADEDLTDDGLAAAFLLPAATGFLFGLDFMGVLGFPWAASRRNARFASLRRSGRVL